MNPEVAPLVQFDPCPCPLCGAEERKTLGSPKVNALFDAAAIPGTRDTVVVQCLRCRMIYAYPMPIFSEQMLGRMYAKGYFPKYTPRWHRIRNVWNPERRFRAAEAALGRPVRRYLEVGSGEGFALEAARKRGWEIHGQDISSQFAADIKERTGEDIFLGPLQPDTFPAGHFDFIYMDSVLEHVDDPIAFMNTLKGYLAPGGVIYAVLPNEDSLPNALKDRIFRLMGQSRTSRICPFDDSFHLLGFSKPSVRFLAEKMDLELVALSCRDSWEHIEKIERPEESTARGALRRLVGLVYWTSDLMDVGINLEAIFRKMQTQ